MHEKIQKYRMEMVMACLLLVVLPAVQTGAVVSVQMNFPKLILIDPGHGEDDPDDRCRWTGRERNQSGDITSAESELETRGYSVAMTRETDKGLMMHQQIIKKHRICSVA